MEIFVTAVLDYVVTIPTRLQFLDRIVFASQLSAKEVVFAKYLLELSLHVSFILYVMIKNIYIQTRL
jgi:hypothetical protein